ncbi:MAG: tripartite tricarboxylate transporter TctB family protein [Candidatus Rokuibacteriota bacterium]
MLRADRVAGAALALLGVLTIVASRALPFGSLRNPGPAFVPLVLAILLIGLGIAITALGRSSPRLSEIGWTEARHAVAIFVACAFVAGALERLGYRITMSLMVFGLLWLVERKRVLFAAVFAVGLSAATYYLFSTVLRVPLPRGPMGL